MSEPAIGDTRVELCSWCKRVMITLTYRPYPLSSGIVGNHWDQGDHECGVVRREKFLRTAGLDRSTVGGA